MKFITAFTNELLLNMYNNFEDNFDTYRFTKQNHSVKENFIRKQVKEYLNKKNYFKVDKKNDSIISTIQSLDPYFEGLEYLYNILNSEASKALLTKIIAYRILGFQKVKLPVNNSNYWNYLISIDNLAQKNDFVKINFLNWNLYKYNLESIGFPIQLYYNTMGILIDFVIKQYEYSEGSFLIKAEENDVVIDAGGCWGDTALYFANEVGSKGHVYTIEFIPSNIELLYKNLQLNPSLEKRITVVPNPLWSTSNEQIYYIDNGPGSRVDFNSLGENNETTQTITIDEIVQKNKITKVDYIKMDIEGVELSALYGAKDTICKFKPKLAIAIYHSLDDFFSIPNYLESLNLGYKFYLGHYTIHAEETVLFAIV
ncbi:FkbM family methyltransferase [Xanthocytophaga agilis]|uniref:FkbM family methyltransferase n=1 Tax=Xanthocytophaga agilis TaxID=3048010 RepID=A0AAE3R8C9_9BACT|nr:FkbM family methyltransferase [Xanthocytophaga agilis]MDJ1502657.1 FkbM family methyltransferase [Xanthocytophaga agilis]